MDLLRRVLGIDDDKTPRERLTNLKRDVGRGVRELIPFTPERRERDRRILDGFQDTRFARQAGEGIYRFFERRPVVAQATEAFLNAPRNVLGFFGAEKNIPRRLITDKEPATTAERGARAIGGFLGEVPYWVLAGKAVGAPLVGKILKTRALPAVAKKPLKFLAETAVTTPIVTPLVRREGTPAQRFNVRDLAGETGADIATTGLLTLGLGKVGRLVDERGVAKKLRPLFREAKKHKSVEDFVDNFKINRIKGGGYVTVGGKKIGGNLTNKELKDLFPRTKGELTAFYNRAIGALPATVKEGVGETIKTPPAKTPLEFKIRDDNKLRGLGYSENQIAGFTPKQKSDIIAKGRFAINRGRLNVNRLDLSPEGKAHIQQIQQDSNAIKERLTFDQIKKTADGLGVDTRKKTTDQMTKEIAMRLNLRRSVVAQESAFLQKRAGGASEEELIGDFTRFANDVETATAHGREEGVALAARRILADEMASPIQKVLKMLHAAGVKPAQYAKDAIGVDWTDARQVTAFYRKFVSPKWSEYINEFRYANMLSSPLTHIINFNTNAIMLGLQPIRKLFAGGFDALRSGITGAKREQFVGEVKPFVRGAVEALPSAFTKAIDTIKGKQDITHLDLRGIPTGKKAMKPFATILRVLEAGDQFYHTLLYSGEMAAQKYKSTRLGKKFDSNIASQKAKDYATNVLFRGELKRQGQGWILNNVDRVTELVLRMRDSGGVVGFIGNVAIPFVRTPAEILKQGVEYSPLGFVNMIGSKGNIPDQLAKATIGSMVFAGSGLVVASTETTWEAPTSTKAREEFFAAGRQEYSILIGGNWYSFSQLGPPGYPIAMAAAIKEALKGREDDETAIATAGNIVSMMAYYFTDQSYMQTVGDLADAIRGDEFKASRLLSDPPQQLVPFRSFLGWVSRIVDPIQRKVDWSAGIPTSIAQSIQAQIPFASKLLPARQTPFGEDLKRPLPFINAFSPIRVSPSRPIEEEFFQIQEDRRAGDRRDKRLRAEAEEMAEGEVATGVPTEKRMKMADAVFRLSNIRKMPEKTEYEKSVKRAKIFEKVDEIIESDLFSDEEKNKIIEGLGVSTTDAGYYRIAGEKEYVRKTIVSEMFTTTPPEELFNILASLRYEVAGKMVLTNGIISDLERDGYLSEEDADRLRAIRWNQRLGILEDTTRARGGGGGGGGASGRGAINATINELISQSQRRSREVGAMFDDLAERPIGVRREAQRVIKPQQLPEPLTGLRERQRPVARGEALDIEKLLEGARVPEGLLRAEMPTNRGGGGGRKPRLSRSSYRRR